MFDGTQNSSACLIRSNPTIPHSPRIFRSPSTMLPSLAALWNSGSSLYYSVHYAEVMETLYSSAVLLSGSQQFLTIFSLTSLGCILRRTPYHPYPGPFTPVTKRTNGRVIAIHRANFSFATNSSFSTTLTLPVHSQTNA